MPKRFNKSFDTRRWEMSGLGILRCKCIGHCEAQALVYES